MKKEYLMPEVFIVPVADFCESINPIGNSVQHGSAKDFKFDEGEDDFSYGTNWDLWETNGNNYSGC